ncbi:MinD/ParA family protein [Brevibacillus dissolubilis]|uniref:MinD/ParA family protein n=1 Tax=Brevibacillus dissolubilis TaxID=1844116 RepID=UPI00111698C3|nr:MinD/ParA family protein [Brevibacillus dissolubilis]
MHDQAEKLRARFQQNPLLGGKRTRLVAVTSGKGGVGKSNFSLNFALGLMEKGQKVVIFDMDIGLANMDVLMGVSPKRHLLNLLETNNSIWDIIEKGPNDLEFIAGGSGFTQILDLDDAQLFHLYDELQALQGYADTIIFDTGAGISKESLTFILSCDEVLLVTTPEPTAITDAYAVIKMIHSRNPHMPIQLVINRVSSPKEGKQTADKLSMVAKRFLGLEVSTLGFVSDDTNVSNAVKRQRPFLLAYPQTRASIGIRSLVDAYIGKHSAFDHGSTPEPTGMRGLLAKMKKWL